MQKITRYYLFPRLRKREVILPRLRGVHKNFTVMWDVTPSSLVVGASLWEVYLLTLSCVLVTKATSVSNWTAFLKL